MTQENHYIILLRELIDTLNYSYNHPGEEFNYYTKAKIKRFEKLLKLILEKEKEENEEVRIGNITVCR